MASSSSSFLLSFIIFLLILFLQPLNSLSLSCAAQTLPRNNLYQHCADLSALNSYIHWTYNSSKPSLSFAFTAPPPKPDGWISWAINPTAPQMVGSQALIAFKQPSGVMTVNTFNVASYASVVPSKISYEVLDMEAEYSTSSNGDVMRIYATVVLDEKAGHVLNHVWQVGSSIRNGIPSVHDFGSDNLNSMGVLDLTKGGNLSSNGGSSPPSGRGGSNTNAYRSKLKKKNIHGILNVVSWGILFPLGILIARYLKAFNSESSAWFYLHVSCQIIAYGIGVAGWGTGLKLGAKSKGYGNSTHRNLGMALFALATLQCFALVLRPKKEHKYRTYWNVYHRGVGYLVVVLGIVNVFKGLDILDPEKKWRVAYIAVLAVLGGIALVLEVVMWGIVLKRKSDESRKPQDGLNEETLHYLSA